MDDWVERAMARWPNVPALYGWLRLNRRGQWLIREGVITNRRIIEVINRNYGVDECGCWYFQNGPQRGYVALDYTPLVLRRDRDTGLATHTGLPVTAVSAALLDEQGSLTLVTEHGPGVIDSHDLDWALDRLSADAGDLEAGLEAALAQPDGASTGLAFAAPGGAVPVKRCDAGQLPAHLGFVREPSEDPDGSP